MTEQNPLPPNSDVPRTILELVAWMHNNCYNVNNYAINGISVYEGLGLKQEGTQYIWYYTERGLDTPLDYYDNEADAVFRAYEQIKGDTWAHSHCVGFTPNATNSAALAEILTQLGIKFMQDSIPYYGIDKPMYRTFVYGCDIKRVEYLKAEYYVEKDKR